MEIFEILTGKLWQSPAIDDWAAVDALGIDLVITLSGLDAVVPTRPNHLVYLDWPIEDGPLPDLSKLGHIGLFAMDWIAEGRKVLTHCAAGINRSSLMSGRIVYDLGIATGEGIVALIRSRRPGALSNQAFADYLAGLV